MATLYMGTTQIAPERTASEIMQVLSRAPGVTQVAHDFNGNGICAINFAVEVAPGQQRAYRLPVRPEAVERHISNEAQAERTAWRLVLRWVQAQLALIETGMVSVPEVFYPYMIESTQDGKLKTVFEGFQDQVKMLPTGRSPRG